jgi:aspartyl-tRNA(Asn)/glutamyl-tRNA(Gln) amidotransferase subunit B
LLYLGVCDGNMEEGSLRCDANVSIRPVGAADLGTKVEIKNLNSFRFLQKALDYEIERQTRAARDGRAIVQETRLWDDGRGCTFSMRSKEEAHDYRYFPEPDLPPLRIDPGRVEEWRRSLPELPHERTARFVAEHGLSIEDALLITSTRRQADYFEECARLSGNPRAVANWMMGDLAYALRNAGLSMEHCPLPAPRLAALIRQVDSGTISGKMAKTVFEEVFRSGDETEVVIRRLGLVQMSDDASLLAVIDKVLAASPKQVEEFRAGKEKVLGYLVGQVMKETKGQANPAKLNELLRQRLTTG